jgi:hypothetical protein
MLQETKLELPTTTIYQDYLNHGGHFAFPEYNFVIEALENGVYCPECPKKRGQILDIASRCNLEVTDTEIAIYTKLRGQTTGSPPEEKPFDKRAQSACYMGDTELIAEIFLLSDKTGLKYQEVIDRYPHIFNFRKF